MSSDKILKESLEADFVIAFREIRCSTIEKFVNTHSDDENYLLEQAKFISHQNQKKLMEEIFEKSKWFASELKQEFDKNWEAEEITELLSYTKTPCTKGFWESDENNSHYEMKHIYCNYKDDLLICRYWSNVINGLINGLSDSLIYSRYESLANEDNMCTIILCEESCNCKLWKEVPEKIIQHFNSLVQILAKFGIVIKFDGYADGTVFYHFDQSTGNHQLLNNLIKLFALRDTKIDFVETKEKIKYFKKANTNI